MSTLQEIRTAIAALDDHDKALLTAELFAEQIPAQDEVRMERSLQLGLEDVRAGGYSRLKRSTFCFLNGLPSPDRRYRPWAICAKSWSSSRSTIKTPPGDLANNWWPAPGALDRCPGEFLFMTGTWDSQDAAPAIPDFLTSATRTVRP